MRKKNYHKGMSLLFLGMYLVSLLIFLFGATPPLNVYIVVIMLWSATVGVNVYYHLLKSRIGE